MTTEEYEALLDNYRGRCDECGRVNVLLEYQSDYDGMRTTCLQDTKECARLATEKRHAAAKALRERADSGDVMAQMQLRLVLDSLEMFRKRPPFAPFVPGKKTMAWRRYGDFEGNPQV